MSLDAIVNEMKKQQSTIEEAQLLLAELEAEFLAETQNLGIELGGTPSTRKKRPAPHKKASAPKNTPVEGPPREAVLGAFSGEQQLSAKEVSAALGTDAGGTLKALVEGGELVQVGKGRGTKYQLSATT